MLVGSREGGIVHDRILIMDDHEGRGDVFVDELLCREGRDPWLTERIELYGGCGDCELGAEGESEDSGDCSSKFTACHDDRLFLILILCDLSCFLHLPLHSLPDSIAQSQRDWVEAVDWRVISKEALLDESRRGRRSHRDHEAVFEGHGGKERPVLGDFGAEYRRGFDVMGLTKLVERALSVRLRRLGVLGLGQNGKVEVGEESSPLEAERSIGWVHFG